MIRGQLTWARATDDHVFGAPSTTPTFGVVRLNFPCVAFVFMLMINTILVLKSVVGLLILGVAGDGAVANAAPSPSLPRSSFLRRCYSR